MTPTLPAHRSDHNVTNEQRLAFSGDAAHADHSQETADRSGVLVVEGEIDVATGTKLRAALAASLAQPHLDVVTADLSAVTFMSSTGIAVLVDANAEAEQAGKTLRLITGGNRAVLSPLRATGVDAMLNLDVDG